MIKTEIPQSQILYLREDYEGTSDENTNKVADSVVLECLRILQADIKILKLKKISHNFKFNSEVVLHTFSSVFTIANKLGFNNCVIFNALGLCHKIFFKIKIGENSQNNDRIITTPEFQLRLAVMTLYVSQSVFDSTNTSLSNILELCIDMINNDRKLILKGNDSKKILNAIESEKELMEKFTEPSIKTLLEWMFSEVDYETELILPNKFLEYFSYIVRLTDYQKKLSYYYLYVSMFNFEIFKFLPDKVAAAALYLSLNINYDFKTDRISYNNNLSEKWESIKEAVRYEITDVHEELKFLINNIKWREEAIHFKRNSYLFLAYYELPNYCKICESFFLEDILNLGEILLTQFSQ